MDNNYKENYENIILAIKECNTGCFPNEDNVILCEGYPEICLECSASKLKHIVEKSEEQTIDCKSESKPKTQCYNYVLQTYDNGDNQYFGCNKNGLARGLSFYPNCNMQCKTKGENINE